MDSTSTNQHKGRAQYELPPINWPQPNRLPPLKSILPNFDYQATSPDNATHFWTSYPFTSSSSPSFSSSTPPSSSVNTIASLTTPSLDSIPYAFYSSSTKPASANLTSQERIARMEFLASRQLPRLGKLTREGRVALHPSDPWRYALRRNGDEDVVAGVRVVDLTVDDDGTRMDGGGVDVMMEDVPWWEVGNRRGW